jgi:hypothetical protein
MGSLLAHVVVCILPARTVSPMQSDLKRKSRHGIQSFLKKTCGGLTHIR